MTAIKIRDCYTTKSVPALSIHQETYLQSPDRQGKRKERKLWRFYNGQTAYVRKWLPGATVIVIDRVPNLAWPHYNVMDRYGKSWIISQLDLSSTTIETKNL
jgi:hypothetical protein